MKVFAPERPVRDVLDEGAFVRPTAVGSYIFAGGFTLGVERYFEVLAHLEGDGAYGADSTTLNWPDLPIFHGPKNWPVEKYVGVDFVYCNPPCAIFSSMGVSMTQGKSAWKTDPRTNCWHDCFRLLETLKPRAWVLESVPNAYTTGRELIDELTKKALLLGYSVTHLLLDAKWCGVAQSRKRFFLVCHRLARLTGYQHNWAPPPTVGEALAMVNETGYTTQVHPRLEAALKITPPGGRLRHYWETINPGFDANRNARVNVRGRPSFQDQRLDPEKSMGVYAGDKLYHPTEDRMIGINEAKALCGFPEDFQLAGNPSGWGSLLARGVMPKVGEWLARAIVHTLGSPDVTERSALRVTFVDVREPDREPVDLTRDYLDDRGRVRLKLQAAVERSPWVPEEAIETSSSPSVSTDPSLDNWLLEEPEETLRLEVTEAVSQFVEEPVAEITSSQDPVTSLREGQLVASQDPVTSLREGQLVASQDPVTSLREGQLVASPVDLPSSEETKAQPGEGSGKLLKRLWLTGRYSPEQLVAIVHQNWAGRNTKVGDVYYNYKKLLEEGVSNVPPWPGGRGSAALRSFAGPVKVSQTKTERWPAPPVASPTDLRPRFLVTGSTAMQVGSQRTQLKIITATAAWVKALEELGYVVDWRPVRPGEDVSHYAGCVVAVNKPNSIASNYFYGALWTLLKRPDAIIAFDDWQTAEVMGGVQSYARSKERAFRLASYGPNRADPSNPLWVPILEYADELHAGICQLAAGDWAWPGVVPILGRGDGTLLKVPTKSLFEIDPTAFTLRYPSEPATSRERRWVQASLVEKTIDRAADWPIFHLGAMNRGKGGVGKVGEDAQPRVTEPELMKIYGENWGVISPAHPHAGSAWWRVRYLMSADARCVLSADPREAACLGEPYLRASDPREVEKLTEEALRELAEAQHEKLTKITWTKDQVLTTLVEVLKSQKIDVPAR